MERRSWRSLRHPGYGNSSSSNLFLGLGIDSKEDGNGDQNILQDGENPAEGGEELDTSGFKSRISRTWKPRDGPTTWVSQPRYEKLSRVVSKAPDEVKLPAVKFDHHSDPPVITILSPRLLSVYKKVHDARKVSNDTVEIGRTPERWPYPDLYRYIDDIRREVFEMDDDDTTEDLKALDFVIREATADIWSLDEVTPKSETAPFYQLWQVFIPGSLVVCRDKLESDSLLMLDYVGFQRHELSLHAWQLCWNNSRRTFESKGFRFEISEFPERRKVTSLVLYPLDALPDHERDGLLSRCRIRGRKWARLVSGPCSCFTYRGLSKFTYTEDPLTRTSGNPQEIEAISTVAERVIVDYSTFIAEKHVLPGSIYSTIHLTLFSRERFLPWDKLSPTHELTDEQAQVCPASVQCTSITSERLHIVCIDNLSNVDWNKQALERLVLPAHQKSMLRSLVKQQTGGKARRGGDLIKAKGQGLVILLHGPPGVGKTLTAESIAEYVERPLLPLSIGNLVHEEGNAEEKLLAVFRKATRWNAILLLDEADVVLEARSFEDIKRNGIVSMLLRNLEYFNGVLFLTTNRISTMDSAFESRIQIAIEYQKLHDTTRASVWRNLVNSKFDSYEEDLAADSTDETKKTAIRESMAEAKSEILENVDVLSNHELNGRQIRNCLNIAEGLAFKDSQETGQMRLRHLTQSVHMALEFQGFFKKARAKAQLDSTSVWAPYNDGDSD